MKKTLTALLLVLALLPGHGPPRPGGGQRLQRRAEGHWAAESIRRATELGLFNGVGGGKFGLGQPITRAAFVTALSRLFDWEAEGSSPELADVPDGACMPPPCRPPTPARSLWSLTANSGPRTPSPGRRWRSCSSAAWATPPWPAP